uniref:C-type lectin domain-containing protein n=1 Tax=Magallana gigas TaxID=29159 RepID=A0A8W8J600_MAGGI
MVVIFFFLLSPTSLCLVSAADTPCKDISSDACRLLAAASPNFCTTTSAQVDVYLSVDFVQCIVSETIGDDFIYHYNLGCVDKSYCTSGTDLPHSPPAVGRRAVYKRNLQFGCCDTDLCNNKLPSELTPTTCPSGTHEFKDGQVHVCYYLLKQERNVDDGAKACADTFHGGKLASMPSRAADEFIKSSLGSEFAGDHSGTFIGVFDKEHELSFVDTDRSPQVFFDWRHGQPNDPNVNDPIREPAQDCVRMFPIDREHFTWQDKPCEQLAWTLCSINIHK